MIRDGKIFFIGFMVVVTPLLGIPFSWKFGIIIFIGLCLIYSSMDFSDFHFPILYKEKKDEKKITSNILEKDDYRSNVVNETKQTIIGDTIKTEKQDKELKEKTKRIRKKKSMTDIKKAGEIDF